jgi:hypothetical protein
LVTFSCMEMVRSRQRNQPAPPSVVFDDLCHPNRQAVRPWLHLLDDEIAPIVLEFEQPTRVVWSSLWIRRPDACVRFDLSAARGGTDLRWSLYVDEPVPDESLAGHMCKRIGELINANLRYTYGH